MIPVVCLSCREKVKIPDSELESILDNRNSIVPPELKFEDVIASCSSCTTFDEFEVSLVMEL